jgi:patatin-related protein
VSDTGDIKTESGKAKAARPHAVSLNIQRENRFAVVMYGGVSLAIYINGVTQELLNLVRATAEETTDLGAPALLDATEQDLTGAISVYRKLGQYLLDRNHENRAKSLMQAKPTDSEIRTRFVVDVISGTSAGGINGMFLAKALARNQGMDGLKNLWLSEGDLSKLLNDKWSIKDLKGFKLGSPQTSLLNSQRMYRKLLEALDNMDRPVPEDAPKSKYSQLVRELDLFITTTDIDGVPLPIGLSDEVVYERRYKNVFHFRYTTPDATGSERDDFIKDNDPFLAFAARCTSSFPFAFEAMRLSDINSIANSFPPYKDKTNTGAWDDFFSDYLRYGLFDLQREARGQKATGHLPGGLSPEEAKVQLRSSFCDRSFGDGGYLDNKPFSYATATLSRRFADTAVGRSLLYVEPTPEHPELVAENRDRPDFAANVQAAVLDLPSKETIREDLDRLYERNEVLERVAMLAKEVDGDVEADHAKRISDEKFYRQGLDEMIDHYGVSYGAYHRLKVTELTNLLTELIARAAGHDPESDAADAIRELVKAWRRSRYVPNPKLEPVPAAGERPKKSENRFLRVFDARYRIRRLAFLNQRSNQLAELDGDAVDLLKKVRAHEKAKWPANLTEEELIKQHGESFQKKLNELKKAIIAPALRQTRAAEGKLRNRDVDPGKKFYETIGQLKIGWPELESILKCGPGVQRVAAADAILKEHDRAPVLAKLAAIIARTLRKREPIKIPASNTAPGAHVARLCLWHYNNKALFYDLVTFPIQYGTGAGETNVVDVFRVSPEDAKNLVDERASDPDATKLAGRAVMSFGAFFDETWRRNDMLWGRLDGAERIISALLQENDDDTKEARAFLINEAHLGILNQEIAEGNADAVCRLLSHALKHMKLNESSGKNLQGMVRDVLSRNSNRLNDAQKTALTTAQTFNRQLKPQRALEYISRSTNITGNMLDGLADQHRFNAGKKAATWISRLGATLWNLIAVAVPQSLGNIFFRHWIGLLYLFSAVVILAGIVFKSVSPLGWQLLGATVSLNVVVWLLGDLIAGKHHWIIVARRAVILIVAILIGCGVFFIATHLSIPVVANHPRRTAVIAVTILLALLAIAEWQRWLKEFLSAPTSTFSYRALSLLTVAAVAVVEILVWIGPKKMAGLELSGTVETANDFVKQTTVPILREQLSIDFLFIVAYACMLASYCVAGAKLFWQRRQNISFEVDQKRRLRSDRLEKQKKLTPAVQKELDAMGSWRLRFFCALVVAGFVVAGLVWVAAFADVTENVGLLLFLKNPTPQSDVFPLWVAYWAATLKFCLIAFGGLYATAAFIFGAWKKTNATFWQFCLRIVFIGVTFLIIYIASDTLFHCRPHPENCKPSQERKATQVDINAQIQPRRA